MKTLYIIPLLFLSLLLACSGRNSSQHDTTLVGSWKYIGRSVINDAPLDGGNWLEWWPANPEENTIFRFSEDGTVTLESNLSCDSKDGCSGSGTYTVKDTLLKNGRPGRVLVFKTETPCCLYLSEGEIAFFIDREKSGGVTLSMGEGLVSTVFKKM